MSERRGLISHIRSAWSYSKGFLEVMLVLTTLGATVIGILVVSEVSKLPDMSYLKNYKPVDSISIYDKHDKVIETIEQGIPRTVIPFSQVPLVMRQAVLAAEDKRFYEHEGISPWGILRATMANAKAFKMVEGGSTITQQLAKKIFFTDVKRTGITKLSEVQHLESIAGAVENMTGITVRERVPDWVVRRADQIELIDSSPEQLRRRLAHGNIYRPDRLTERSPISALTT